MRPFKILGIQQIAIGGADKQRLKKLWVDLLGFQYKDTFVSEQGDIENWSGGDKTKAYEEIKKKIQEWKNIDIY